MRLMLLLLSFLLFLSFSGRSADWPCWRGPDGLGISTEKGVPDRWDHEKNIGWRVPLPGKGASSPIVVGARVYVTSQTSDNGLHVIALDRDNGAIAWDKEIGRGRLSANNLHNMATPTAVSDGKSIWAIFGTGDLAELNANGEVLWQRNLVSEYGKYHSNHGYGSSPMLLDGRLFVVCMHQGPSYVLAIDAHTGKNLWKKDRNLEPKDEAQDSYSSPIFLRSRNETQMIVAGAESINAYDPKSGQELWMANGMSVPHHAGRTIAGPVAGEGMVVNVASGFQNRGYTVAFKADGQGNISQAHKAWTQNRFSSDCPTPVIYAGKLFTIRDDGNASCLDLKSGEPYWQERIFSENVKVSPVAADGKVYFTSGQANCYVLKASEKFSMISTNRLNESTLSTPAISNGKLFIRTDAALYCIRN